MDNETQSTSDTARNDVPVTERVTSDVREQAQAQTARAADGAQHAADAARARLGNHLEELTHRLSPGQ